MPKISKMPVKLALLILAEAILLLFLWKGVNQQMAGMNQAVNDISDLVDPSPFRAALMGYLGKIHLGLQGYLRTSDKAVLEQVALSRKDFTLSLPEFQKQNPKLFPKSAVEEIQRSYGIFNQAVDHTLEGNVRRMKVRGQIDQNFARILMLIERNIKPLIRADQAEGEERKEAALNVENQARAWQQNIAKAWAQLTSAAIEFTYENDNRGTSYIDRYARMELLARERKVLKEVRGLWQANSDLARESFALEKVVNESEAFMDAQRGQVVQALNRYLPVMPPAELAMRKKGFVLGIRIHGAAAFMFGLVALASLAGIAIGIYRVQKGVPLWTPRAKPKSDTPTESKPKTKEPTLQMDLKGRITHMECQRRRGSMDILLSRSKGNR
jgi:hypothetical protein